MTDKTPYQPDCIDVEAAYGGDIKERLKLMAWTARLALFPHAQNSPERKMVTAALLIAWMFLTVAKTTELVTTVDVFVFGFRVYSLLTAIVWLMVADQYGFERGILAQVSGAARAPSRADDVDVEDETK